MVGEIYEAAGIHVQVGGRQSCWGKNGLHAVTDEKLDKWFVDLVAYLEQDVEGGVEIMTKANSSLQCR